jgi:4-amino-4-deoxy-L-arabinose transferase-like glycosyltransferase
MAYAEDVKTLARLQKYRLVGVVIAVSLSILAVVVDVSLWTPRFLAWVAIAVICCLEARVTKRLGRDATACWLRAAVMGLVAVSYFFF